MHEPTKTVRFRRIAGAVLILGGAGATAACSDGAGDGVFTPPPAPPPVVPPPPPPPPPMGAARFGANFAVSFNANPNSDPREPSQGDIIPPSFTTDPLDV